MLRPVLMLFDCKEVKNCQFFFSVPEHPKIFPLEKKQSYEVYQRGKSDVG